MSPDTFIQLAMFLPTRARHALAYRWPSCHTLSDLRALTKAQLLSTRGLGEKTAAKTIVAMRSVGLPFPWDEQ